MTKESIKEGLTRLFTQNIGLKIVSIIIAFTMWLIVVNVTDPADSSTYRDIPVNIVNLDSINAQNLTMKVLDNTDVVSSITVRAPRSVIAELDKNQYNIMATADLRYLSEDRTEVPIEVSLSKYADKIESIKISNDKLKVSVENKKTVQLPITSTTSGEIESGYIIGNITQAQNQVRITGPQSVVASVAKASVDVQVTGFVENISTSSDIILYDSQGNVIDDSSLDMNISSIKVDVEILATRKVPVTYSFTGTPADGADVTGEIESDVTEVVIAGPGNRIDKIDSIEVPENAINVSGLSTTLHVVVNLSDYLPNGVRLGDPTFNGLANVSVYIEEYVEKSFSVYLRNIEVLNLPEGFSTTEWVDKKDYVEFTLKGLSQNLEQVQLSQLDFSVDFNDYALMNDISGFRAGTYKLPLIMNLPEDVWMEEPVEISVKLVK